MIGAPNAPVTLSVVEGTNEITGESTRVEFDPNQPLTTEIMGGEDRDGMGLWQGVAMDSLKFHPGLPCPTLLRPRAGHPWNSLTAVYGVARPQGGLPAAVFFPFGHPCRTAIRGGNMSSDIRTLVIHPRWISG
jgi:hypothetical protein